MPSPEGNTNLSNEILPEILGKILFLQSVLHSMPTNKSMAEFLCRGLTKIEFIKFAAIRIGDEIYSSNFKILDKISHKESFKAILKDSDIYSKRELAFEIQNGPKDFILHIQTSLKVFGTMILISEKINSLPLYIPFIESLTNTLALNMENRERAVALTKLNDQLMNEKENLELRVNERTKELVKINLKLRKEIAERKQIEKALGDSEERWQFALEGAEDGVWDWNAKTGSVYFSPQWKSMLGFEDKEIKNEFVEWEKRLHPEDKEKIFEIFNKHLNGETDFYINEHRLLCKDGKYKWILDRGKVIERDESGNPIRVIGTHTDISEMKKVEEALKNNEERFNQVAVCAGTWVWEVDKYGLYTYASSTSEQLLGYKPEELVGKKYFYDFFMPESREQTKTMALQIFEKKGSFSGFENINLKMDGSVVILETTGVPIFNNEGELIGYRGTDKDITEKKKAEEEILREKERAEVADRMKTEFLAQMSHEIRSPLNAVLSLSSLLKEEVENFDFEDGEIYFSGIESASKRIIRTVDSILNMSDLQLGTYQGTKRKLDVVEFLENLYKEFESLAADKNIDLQLKCDAKKKIIEVDDYAFSQILVNLIDNAIKYTKEGFIKIKLNIKDGIKIEIKDSGIGISEEYLSHIFAPFSQEEQGYTRKYEGNGLGLALVKKYCDIINADIFVKSKKNKGTTFSLILKDKN